LVFGCQIESPLSPAPADGDRPVQKSALGLRPMPLMPPIPVTPAPE
jgi:hypothetical protein